MPSFEYEALEASGRTRRGMVTADTARLARQELRRLSMTPVNISSPREDNIAAARGKTTKKISSGDLVAITRQLAALVGAALPLEEALSIVALQAEKPHTRKRMLAVRERVMEGWRIADALSEHPRSFPALYRAVISAGETAGDLGGVMDRLATMLEKDRSMRGKALGAIIYPAALIVIAGAVVTALMTQVVPKIVEQFDTFGATLPAITQAVMAVSNFLSTYGLIILVSGVAAGFGLWRGLKAPAFKLQFDRRLLKFPIIGRLARGLDAARFARTLSTLFAGGAPLLDSLDSAARTVSNSHIRESLYTANNAVREGAALSSALRRVSGLPPMMAPMIAAGEHAGAMPAMLDKVALQLEEEFDSASVLALRLLEPAIIVAMGGVILVIVVSIMLPILRLNSLAAG